MPTAEPFHQISLHTHLVRLDLFSFALGLLVGGLVVWIVTMAASRHDRG
jgi:hypothetical protein